MSGQDGSSGEEGAPSAPARRIDPEGLLLERRKARIDAVVDQRLQGLTVVLEQVHDPHNLAAVLRTVEGLGLQEVQIVQSPAGFRPNPAVTQGADKWLDVRKHPSAEACADRLRAQGYRLYGSRLEGPVRDLEELEAGGKLALIFGNEHAGLSPAFAERCDGFFKIPMFGFAQSFNVSVAVAIALATVRLARRRAGESEGDLSPEERAELRARFYGLAVKQGHRLDRGGA